MHGHPRYTKDIDLQVLEKDIPAILKVAAAHGYEFPAHPMTFRSGTPEEMQVQRVTKVVAGEHLVLDLIVVSGILEWTWNSRIRHEDEVQSIIAVSKAGLIAMKRLADRDQDRVDIKTLEAYDV